MTTSSAQEPEARKRSGAPGRPRRIRVRRKRPQAARLSPLALAIAIAVAFALGLGIGLALLAWDHALMQQQLDAARARSGAGRPAAVKGYGPAAETSTAAETWSGTGSSGNAAGTGGGTGSSSGSAGSASSGSAGAPGGTAGQGGAGTPGGANPTPGNTGGPGTPTSQDPVTPPTPNPPSGEIAGSGAAVTASASGARVAFTVTVEGAASWVELRIQDISAGSYSTSLRLERASVQGGIETWGANWKPPATGTYRYTPVMYRGAAAVPGTAKTVVVQ